MTQEEFHKRYQYNPTADCLGEGGFGKVYKAYDTHRDRYVAIKMAEVRPHLEDVRLRKEVEIISKLPSHPNIAYYEECYTFSTFAGEYDFGVLQYYEEGNLQQLLTDKQLDHEQKESLLRQILEGILFLHSQGIIHRDLKPQNILIVNRNGKYIPKITDFGISKKLDENKSSIFTNSLAGAGTLSFASPEQLMGNTIRKNTDLWSFGVIACWVFTGKLPFNTGEQAVTSEAGRIELFKQITSGDITSIIQLLPISWRNLLNHCLKVDIDNRISSASKCLEMLDGKVETINKEPLSENTTINEAIITRKNETKTPVVKEIEVEKPATNETVIGTQTNEKANPDAKEIEVEKPTNHEAFTSTQTNETGASAANEIEVAETIFNETICNKQTINTASPFTKTEVSNSNLTHAEPLPKSQSEPVLFETAPESINYTPWIIFCLVIVTGLVIFFGKPNWSSNEEQLEFARQDSIAMADSLAFAQAELLSMEFVQGGTFNMGTNNSGDREKPMHSVTLNDFFIGKYEVTQKQWQDVMGSNPSFFPGCDDCPVEQVSWNDVQEFIQKLNQQNGKIYRLPTEAEWEYAAKGGNKSNGYYYSGSHNIEDVAWYNDNSEERTQYVGQKQPNELGLFDMSGNVWEFCSDFDSDYTSSAQNNPIGPSSGSYHMCRGGGWNGDAQYCYTSLRAACTPDQRGSNTGFRLVFSN
jgi:formylglycine-generating enzyme required for sulfatase activity/tRNA A-37 threonylcarbamoyl transferase component Bud32